MLTPAALLNFCCRVETTTAWPCCSCVAVADALLCCARNCCRKPGMVPLYGVRAEPIPVCGDQAKRPAVSCENTKSARAVSPDGVSGEVLYTVSFEASDISAGLTMIRPANPVICGPSTV